MSILDRVLLLLLSIGGAIVGIGLILLGAGALGSSAPAWAVAAQTDPSAVYVIVIGLVFTLIALRFVFYRWRPAEVEHVALTGDHGQIRISFETIRQLATRAGRGVRGVHEFDARVRMGQAGLILFVRVRALPDVDLARMSNELQDTVKSYVERTAGVSVERVSVHVAEIAQGTAKGARAWVE
jgi:uncharacterized alkaline shock family protein YloU